ncbi:hypothetical protein D3C75_925950 [compost metagenome]
MKRTACFSLWCTDRSFLKHEVEIRPAEAERTDACPQRNILLHPRPLLKLIDHIDGRTYKVDERIGIIKMEGADEFLMLE